MAKKIKDDERVSVDYEKVVRIIGKRKLNISTVSTMIGYSPSYISAMYKGNSKMLYCDVKAIAKILDLHGGTKLLPSNNEDCSINIDKDAIEEIKANISNEERIADALERIAICLERKYKKSAKENNDGK